MSTFNVIGCEAFIDGKYKEAHGNFSLAIEREELPAPLLLLRRAEASIKLGEWEEAQQDLNNATERCAATTSDDIRRRILYKQG